MFSLFGFNFIEVGGYTLLVLIFCALLSWIVIIERFLYYSKMRSQSPLERARTCLRRRNAKPEKDLGRAQNIKPEPRPATTLLPIEYVLDTCLDICSRLSLKDKQNEKYFEESKERAITEKLPEIERYLNIQATLGTLSPYIGLLGTVFGIIRAFSGLGIQAPESNAQVNELNAGIAQALVATAAGLLVAIPATVAYNYFRGRVQTLIQDIEVAVSYLKAHVLGHIKLE